MPIATVPVVGILEHTPDPYQKLHKIRTWRNNTKGRIEIQISKDGGTTYKTIYAEPSAKVQAGSVPTIQDDGSVEWAPVVASSSSSTSTTSSISSESVQSGKTDIVNGSNTVFVLFAVAFASAPIVPLPSIVKNSSLDPNFFVLTVSDVTNSGFTAHLSDNAPLATYDLHWTAFLPS